MPHSIQIDFSSRLRSVLCRTRPSLLLLSGLIALASWMMATRMRHPVRAAAFASVPFPYSTYLWVWGFNQFGELGDNATVASDRPLLNFGIPQGTLLSKLAAGDALGIGQLGSHSLALDRNNGIWGWGDNQFGEVGNGNAGAAFNAYAPVQVCAPGQTAPCTQFFGGTAMSAGGFHSLALDSVGRVWGWGYNSFGQLGRSIQSFPYSPVPVWNTALTAQLSQQPGVPLITAISAGSIHSLALDSRGIVWAWGSNVNGQLGNGTARLSNGAFSYPPDVTADIATPVTFPAYATIKAIAAGGTHSLALDSYGNVWAWGNNQHGQLGISDQSVASSNVPTMVTYFPANTVITAIAAGAGHSLAIDSTGAVWAWGQNSFGQLGNNTAIDSYAPAKTIFSAGTRIGSIAAGGEHSLAIDADHNVFAWGRNNSGQLGNKQMGVDSQIPVRSTFPAGTRIVGIAAGSEHSLAIESRSFLYGIEAVLSINLANFRAQLLPQSLTSISINVTSTFTALDKGGQNLLVTDTLTDNSGNTQVLTFIQQNGTNSLSFQIQSVQYNGGPVITLLPNRIEYDWKKDSTGAIASLNQSVMLDRAENKTEITASYKSATNTTAIQVELPTGTQNLIEAGIITLQLSTINGNLSFSDGTHVWPQ